MDSINAAQDLDVASFVCSFYRLCQAKIETDGRVVKISIDDDLAKKLDGPWARRYELEFVFREQDLAERETAELVTLGSYRFHYLAQLALQKGLLCKIALSSEALPAQSRPQLVQPGVKYYQLNSKISYRPSLAITYIFAFYGESRWEENKTFVIDRINGRVFELAWEKIFGYVQNFGPEHNRGLQAPKISLKKSYTMLEQAALDWLATRDQTWTIIAQQKLEAEQAELNEYYHKKHREEAAINPEAEAQLRQIWQIRLKEQQERFAPKVLVRPVQYAFIAVPEAKTVYLRTGHSAETKITTYLTPFYSESAD